MILSANRPVPGFDVPTVEFDDLECKPPNSILCECRPSNYMIWIICGRIGWINIYTRPFDSQVFCYSIFYAFCRNVSAMRPSASQPCAVVPSQRPVDDEQLQHRQHSTDACPTIGITVYGMSGAPFLLVVPVTQTLCFLKRQIAERLCARLSDLSIVFQLQLVGDEGSVRDFGLVDGSVLQVVRKPRIPRCVELVVFVYYMYSVKRPWRSAEFNFRFEVPWNMPCSATIKAEVMRIFDGTGNAGVQKMTNPHLFLLNYELGWNKWFSLGDEDCLDEVPEAFDPYEVYVIDQTQCRCGTCDPSWMLEGWRCRRVWQVWQAARSGRSDSSSSSDVDVS